MLDIAKDIDNAKSKKDESKITEMSAKMTAYGQEASIMAANPAYARLSEAQRQEFAEVLILNFLIQHAAYIDALKRGDRDAQRRIGDAAVARFKSEMGVDLRRLRLTNAGFVRT